MNEAMIAKELLGIFSARKDMHATASYDGNNVSYFPVKSGLNEELLLRHIRGEICLGSYQLSLDNTVNWLGWDIDSPSLEEARRDAQKIIDLLEEIPHGVEFSGSKGYHVLILLAEPMPAAQAKMIGDQIRSASGLASTGSIHCEVFPKQSALSPNNPLGNLLKIPLGRHPRSHEWSRFVDPKNGWESGPSIDPLEILLHRADPKDVVGLSMETTPEGSILDIITPYWQSGDRHALALAISGFLAHLGWGAGAVEELVEQICERTGDDDVSNRIEAVQDTFKKVLAKETVAGYSILAEILPSSVLRTLTQLAASVQIEPGVQRIDDIRLRRGSPHIKVRLAEATIWSELCSSGRFVKTDMDVYYLDTKEHRLFPLPEKLEVTNNFLQILHRKFGINYMESFGRQVTSGLLMKAGMEADLVKVYRRSHWDGKRLYLSLGGPEIYALDGHKVELTYNGECGYIFRTKEDGEVTTIALDMPFTENKWHMLVDHLSLSTSKDAPATPEQQLELLKAWILNTFFPELAPTKPLLMCLGTPGSGKTTAMRSILKILEGWDSDVMELSTDKQDSIRASITNHTVLVLDNLEKTSSKWLVDVLNRVATGSHIELRKLYSTNEVVRYKPDCFIAMTAVSIPFADETVFDRMLPIEFQRLKEPIPEYQLQSDLLSNYIEIWLSLLHTLNKIIHSIKNFNLSEEPVASRIRMADFYMFCQILSNAGIVDQKILNSGMNSLSDQQQHALAENSPFVEALDIWIQNYPEEAKSPHTAGELMVILQSVVRSTQGITWKWNTVQGLSRHIASLEPRLVELYGAKIDEVYDSSRSRYYKRYVFDIDGIG